MYQRKVFIASIDQNRINSGMCQNAVVFLGIAYQSYFRIYRIHIVGNRIEKDRYDSKGCDGFWIIKRVFKIR